MTNLAVSQSIEITEFYGKDSSILVNDKFIDDKSIHDYLLDKQIKAYSSGYLEYSVDSIVSLDSLHRNVYIYRGGKYVWGNIGWNVENGLLIKSGLDPEKLKDKTATGGSLLEFYEKLIKYYEDNGYPFVRAKLTSVEIQNDTISGAIEIQKGEKYTYDTLAVYGNLKIKRSYLEQYLNLQKGAVYKEKDFTSISKKIKELPFAIQMEKAQVEFGNQKAIIHLYLKKKSANFFNGVIGILPNSPQVSQLNTGSNLLVTGDIKLILINSLKKGEKMDFAWTRLKPETQRLKVGIALPYLFNSPFGIDDKFDLLKQDSSFINVSNQLGIIYSINSDREIKVFWENNTTNVLNDTHLTNALASQSSNSYGINFKTSSLDYKYNPTKGYALNFVFQAGTRTITGTSEETDKVEVAIPSTDPDIVITALVPKSGTIYKLQGDAEFYFPFFKITTLKLGVKNAYIINDFLFDNDLNRIGGFNLLRGFDEQSMYTSLYSVWTLEYRLLLEQNSFFGFFLDQAYTQKKTYTESVTDFPFGFGASINFQTKPGIFSVMYAVGKQKGNLISFQSAKIHFGFVSLF